RARGAARRGGADQGASWPPPGPSDPPRKAECPAVKDAAWPRNPIDRFILARLEAEDLDPSPEADPTTLVRRAFLDLTGLSPTPREVDAFLADSSDAGYERLIDRLLDSPRHREPTAPYLLPPP